MISSGVVGSGEIIGRAFKMLRDSVMTQCINVRKRICSIGSKLLRVVASKGIGNIRISSYYTIRGNKKRNFSIFVFNPLTMFQRKLSVVERAET